MIAGAVAVRLLVGARRHLGYVRVHRAVGEQEDQTAAAGAAVGEILQPDPLEIGDEVRLPGVVALADQFNTPSPAKYSSLADPVVEVETVVEHEAFIVEQIEHHRQVGRGSEKIARSRPLPLKWRYFALSGIANRLVGHPFELPPLPARQLDLGVSAAFDDIDHLLEQVALRDRRLSGTELVQEHVAEVAATVEVKRRAAGADPRPVLGSLDLRAINRQAFDHLQPLGLEPVLVQINSVASLLEHVHRV